MKLPKGELTQADNFLLRKYCNAFLSDFKIKDVWTEKDRDQLAGTIRRVDDESVVEKIKFIIIHQISIMELSKFLDMKAEDLNKGLLEASKQIK
jgi:hypothetical protein